MSDARIGFCCSFVSPSGGESQQRLINMRHLTVTSIAGLDLANLARAVQASAH
ncbi:MAG TPA: hypothetical protein VF637_06405 [Sphingomicrobium sp.]|jgi:hypothetical protein